MSYTPDTVVPTDRIFAERVERAHDFAFDRRTAEVFDDMVGRSVPFYDEMQRMTAEIAADFATPGSNLYDLGCSTGTTLAMLDPLVDPTVRFVGMDNSAEMLGKAREKLGRLPPGRQRDLVQADLHELPPIENASVVILALTLQFVRPLQREGLIRTICAGTNDQGCLILLEKLTEADTLFNRLFIKYYYNMKRRTRLLGSRDLPEAGGTGERPDPVSPGGKPRPSDPVPGTPGFRCFFAGTTFVACSR